MAYVAEDDQEIAPATRRHELAGRTIAGKYFLESYVGSGSTGAVYRARHSVLEKPLALKILDPELAHRTEFVALFEREARAASRIDHVNSVRVLDFGADISGLLYIAMEFVEGPDLFQLLDEHYPLATPRVIEIMSQILAALSQAHELGVIHRDLKPENILVLSSTNDDGRPTDLIKVCDFGVAQLGPAAVPARPLHHAITSKPPTIDLNTLVGTPEYMSPEQARAEALDPRSDVYAAGVVLYQLLTGRLPFMADTPEEVAAMHCTAPPPPPSSLACVDARLEAICLTAMHKDPEQRYQSARDMRAALRRAAQLEQAEALSLRRAGSTRLAYPVAGDVDAPSAPTLTPGLVAPSDPDSLRPPPSLLARSRSRFGNRPAVIALSSLLAPGIAAAVLWLTPSRLGSERGNPTPSAAPNTSDLAAASAFSLDPVLVATRVPPAEQAEEAPLLPPQRERRALRRARREARAQHHAEALPAAVGLLERAIPSRPEPWAGTRAEASAAAAPDSAEVGEQGPLPYAGPAVAATLLAAEHRAQPPSSPDVADPGAAVPSRAAMKPQAAPGEPRRLAAPVVRIRGVSVRGPLATSVVRRAIDRAHGRLSACFVRSARLADRSAPEAIEVELEFDERGRARHPRAVGGSLPGLDRCIVEVASELAIDQAPDTGVVKASWSVAFERR